MAITFTWLKNNAIRHVIFILIILYSVSSINVLILTIGILPLLQGAFLNTPVLGYFSIIACMLAAILGIFHASTIFRRKKRRQDRTESLENTSIKTAWFRSRLMNKVIFALVIVFFIFSIYMLFWNLGIAERILTAEDDMLLITYSIVSFAIATLISGFHLATLIFRQKRAADHLAYAQRLN